jgi:hypothetical protein
MTGSGGAGGPYTFSASGLPVGITMSTGGTISGTATVNGTFNYTVTVTDKSGNTGTLNCSVTVTPPVSATCAVITAVQGVAITPVTMIASGGAGGPYTFTATGLPAGITISTSGTISGTATVSGTFSYTVTIKDKAGNTGTLNCSVTVTSNLNLTCGTCFGKDAQVGVAYSAKLTATGGNGSYTFKAISGLPPGLTLNPATGAITGTPTVAGTYSLVTVVTDSAGNSATAACPIVVKAIPVNLECSICGSNKATVGTPYSVTLNATGGTGSYTYSVSGSLPPGLSLTTKGVIAGTPTTAGTYTFSVKATDTSGAYDTATCTIVVVNSPINLNCGSCGSSKAHVGTAYTSNFTASGGTGSYVYSIVSGSLPPGLTLNATTGAVTGKPTTLGIYTFTAKVVDTKTSYTDTATCSITVSGVAVNLECGICGTGNAKVGTYYSSKLAVSGGTGSFTYSIVAGSLPPGMSLNSSTGAISGTPSSPGSYTFTSKVYDASGTSDTAICTIVVTGTVVNLDCGLCKVGKVTTGAYFSSQFLVTGGAAPYTFSIVSGSLPPGLKLDAATGKITGTPTTPGTYNFTARVTDKHGNTDTDSCTLTVSGVALDIQCGACSANNATAGTAYSNTLAATGGYPGYTFSIVSGTLPAGLTLSSSGAISGTPTKAGNYTFTAKVTDSRGNTDTVTCTLAVAAAPLDLQCGTCGASKATIGVKYSVAMRTTGGTGTLSFAVTSGSLPAGLTMNSSGVISGTPSASSGGTYTFTTTVTDANHKTDTAVCTITVSKC